MMTVMLNDVNCIVYDAVYTDLAALIRGVFFLLSMGDLRCCTV